MLKSIVVGIIVTVSATIIIRKLDAGTLQEDIHNTMEAIKNKFATK